MMLRSLSRSCVSRVRVSSSRRGRVVVSRRFCDNTKAKLKDSPPPPPPPPEGNAGGGGGGLSLVLLAAAAGAGYYFQDDIKGFLGMGGSKTVDDTGLSPSSLKKEVESLGNRLKEEEKAEQAQAAATPVAPAASAATPAPASSSGVASNAVATVKPAKDVDYEKVKEAIASILDDENYDDGSYGPVFVRLAWHAAGTYDKNTKKGGSEGAGMRFAPESEWGANAGLDVARAKLEPIKQAFPGITYSDLWSLAGTVALEEMGATGIAAKWRPGRKDFEANNVGQLPDGLLPDADGRDKKSHPADHLRDIFYRMGFNDREIVALSGAHAMGRCHTDRSGFWGPWTNAPTTFSNEYFRLLVEEKWTKKTTHEGKTWNGPEQYEDPSGALMMLPTDLALVQDEKMNPVVQEYAKNEGTFTKDFVNAWIKLQELGVRRFHGTRRYYLFGPRE